MMVIITSCVYTRVCLVLLDYYRKILTQKEALRNRTAHGAFLYMLRNARVVRNSD